MHSPTSRHVAVLFLFASLFCSGCASMNRVLVHPESRLVVDCSTSGWGWLGTPVAVSMATNCTSVYESLGYVRMEQYVAQGGDTANLTPYTPPTLFFSSEKSGAAIYTSDIEQKEFSQIKFTAPVTIYGAAGTLHWQPECYKAVRDSIESNIVCKDQQEVMRYVHFTWPASSSP